MTSGVGSPDQVGDGVVVIVCLTGDGVVVIVCLTGDDVGVIAGLTGNLLVFKRFNRIAP